MHLNITIIFITLYKLNDWIAADAKQFFLRSQLATADLGKIWYWLKWHCHYILSWLISIFRSLAKVSMDPRLNFNEFAIAFFMIKARLAGQEIPQQVPQSLLVSVGMPASSAPSFSASASNPSIFNTNGTTGLLIIIYNIFAGINCW